MPAEIHQTTVTPAADPTVVLPRSEEAQTPSGDPTEKAALEAKERMAKTQGFWNRISPEQGEKKTKNKEEPAKAEPEGARPAEAKPSPTEAEKKLNDKKGEKKPSRRRNEPEIDPIQIAEATGQAIGREMAKAAQPVRQPATTPAEAEPELPEEFRADIAVFDEMARLDPKKYGSIKKDIARYAQAESEYIAKWEQENDGQTFDGDSNEHDAFYDRIRPNYDLEDFKAAEKSLLKNEVRNEVKREVSEEIKTREKESERRREIAAQIEPEAARETFSTLGEMITQIDPDNAELAKDWESMKTIDDKNPILSDAMRLVHDSTRPVVVAVMRLFRGIEDPEQNNPVHQRVFNLIELAEQRLSQLPIKDRYDDDGRLFATQADYSKMNQAERARHWYLNEPEVLALLRGQAISQTKLIYEREKQKVARYTKQPIAAQTTQQPTAKKSATSPETRQDNGSPSVTGRGTLPGDGQSGATKAATGQDMFFSRFLGA